MKDQPTKDKSSSAVPLWVREVRKEYAAKNPAEIRDFNPTEKAFTHSVRIITVLALLIGIGWVVYHLR